MNRPTAAVEQEPYITRLDQMRRCDTRRMRCRSPGTDGRQSHGWQVRRKTAGHESHELREYRLLEEELRAANYANTDSLEKHCPPPVTRLARKPSLPPQKLFAADRATYLSRLRTNSCNSRNSWPPRAVADLALPGYRNQRGRNSAFRKIGGWLPTRKRTRYTPGATTRPSAPVPSHTKRLSQLLPAPGAPRP